MKQRVTFTYINKANSVKIAGTFTSWNVQAMELKNRIWIWEVDLECYVRHQYKIIVNDTNWILDPENPFEDGQNSILWTPQRVVEFSWKGGNKVELAGEFSDWKPLPMSNENGVWFRRVRLPCYYFYFKFVVDGKWEIDHSLPSSPNRNGQVNNVIEVKPLNNIIDVEVSTVKPINNNIPKTKNEIMEKDSLLPKQQDSIQQDSKLIVRLIIYDSISPELARDFKQFLKTQEEFTVNETRGVTLVLASAITERVTHYFPNDIDVEACVPVVIQRTSSIANPIYDPWGNLVVVFIDAQDKFQFKNKTKFVDDVRKICNKTI